MKLALATLLGCLVAFSWLILCKAMEIRKNSDRIREPESDLIYIGLVSASNHLPAQCRVIAWTK